MDKTSLDIIFALLSLVAVVSVVSVKRSDRYWREGEQARSKAWRNNALLWCCLGLVMSVMGLIKMLTS